MKKITVILLSGMIFYSCTKEKKQDRNLDTHQETSVSNDSKPDNTTTEINWDEVPNLKDIGSFPFITAPSGLKIKNENDGLSEVFANTTMENYTGKNIYTTEGRLGIISFDGIQGNDFSRTVFDKNIYPYFDKIGAKMIYKGDFPESENERSRLEKNMWNGKYGTNGLIRESDAPFTVYAFKNNDKKYIVNIQSNSAQGTVFIMEVQNAKKP